MTIKKLLVLLLATVMLAGCSPVEQQARNVGAALSGTLVLAQQQFLASCQATPTAAPCQAINRAIVAQGALITASETYCGWAVTPAPPDPNATCVPVKTAAPALQAAIANANQFITELRGVIQ